MASFLFDKTSISAVQDYLNELLTYDIESGVCVWKRRSRTEFGSSAKAKAWNNKHAEQEAGTIHVSGRLYAHLQGKSFPLDTLIWIMIKGEYPEKGVFHLNTHNGDNRLDNLTLTKQNRPSKYRGGSIYLMTHDYHTVFSREDDQTHIFSNHLDFLTAKRRVLELADYLQTSWEIL